MGCGEAGLLQPRHRVFHQIGVLPVLLKHPAHSCENFGVQVAGTLAEIGGDAALHLLTVDQAALVVHVQHLPDMPRNGQLLPHGRRRNHRPQLLRLAADGVFLTFLKHAVELEGVDDPLPRQSHDQTALLRLLNVVCGDEMPEQHPVVLLRDPVEVMQPQHPVGQRPWGQLAAGSQGGHGLVGQ